MENKYGCSFSIGGAIAVIIVAILMSAIMTSCKAKYVPIENVIFDVLKNYGTAENSK